MGLWLLALIFLVPSGLRAQSASSSTLLFNPSPLAKSTNEAETGEKGVQLGRNYESPRYTVRPGLTPIPRAPSEQTRKEPGANATFDAVGEFPPKLPKAPLHMSAAASSVHEEREESKANTVPPHSQINESSSSYVAEDDFRLNMVDVSFASGVLGNRSDSKYSYRRYGTVSPFLAISTDIWLRPDWGLSLDYSTSLNASLAGVSSSGAEVPSVHQRYGAGIQVRHMFSYQQQSPILVYGLQYTDYRLVLPLSATERGRLRTSGLSVGARLLVPQTEGKFWEWGVELAPTLRHQEEATGLSLESGQSVDTSSVVLQMGSHYRLSKSQEFFWRMRCQFERNQYRGAARAADPLSGSTPENVGVENIFLYLVLGVSWGQ